jgi:putative ABC transport system permease protein
MIQNIMSFLRDLRFGARSLARSKGLTATVVLTLALGIGANAAMFSLIRGVLLRPLVNRDEGRLIYIRQSESGIGNDNATFSIPEIGDLRSSVKTLSSFGDFSQVDFTMLGSENPARLARGWLVDRTSRSWACARYSGGCWIRAMTVRRP